MMFTLIPGLPVLLAIVALAAVAGVAVAATAAVSFFVTNHRARVAERKPLVRYYRQLALGH